MNWVDWGIGFGCGVFATLLIGGVGVAKLQKYGPAFLAVIQSHSDA